VDPDACARLRAARVAANLSLREVSRRVGISASMLSQIENGAVAARVDTLYAIAGVLELSMEALFKGL